MLAAPALASPNTTSNSGEEHFEHRRQLLKSTMHPLYRQHTAYQCGQADIRALEMALELYRKPIGTLSETYKNFIGNLLECYRNLDRVRPTNNMAGVCVFKPSFQISAALAKVLMDIEASRQAVSSLPITVKVLTSLRASARLISTHYSTQIEGNRLTQQQVADVLNGGTFPNRERDQNEVKNYFRALGFLDTLINTRTPTIQETDIQTLHGLVMDGKPRPTPYRDGQNVIRDSGSGSIVYMPPEAKDVPALVQSLVTLVNGEIEKSELPIPIIAAIAHYQFATIHPYYDGNGRTARLLTNLVLHKCGYGLKSVYSLEEYYARNLQGYYRALSIGESHNYYFGRAEAGISQWVNYFCQGMADAFAKVRLKASQAEQHAQPDHSALLRQLDQKQRLVLALFQNNKYIASRDIADLLQVHTRTALNFCHKWIGDGFIVAYGDSNKNRKYELAKKWLELL